MKHKPLSRDIMEDASAVIARERSFAHWMDQIVAEHERQGGAKDLPGYGKPVEVQDTDPLNSILKNANFLPPWLQLRQEIVKGVARLIESMELDPATELIDKLQELNQLIMKYNEQVPSYTMQRMLVDSENLNQQYQKWM